MFVVINVKGNFVVKKNALTVVFTVSLTVLSPAVFKSPCNILFGIVPKFDKLLNTLLVPFLIGDGSLLYPLAKGLKIALSKA